MLTPQDIQNKGFEKAVFGGYDMAAVDEFLEQVVADYAALAKENSTLRSKMKVLVEKVEEYRSTEDAMRMALLTAQKMSDEMTEKAKKQAEEVVAKAEETAAQRAKDLHAECERQTSHLQALKQKTLAYIEESAKLCQQQVEFLGKLRAYETGQQVEDPADYAPNLPEEPAAAPEPAPAAPVQEDEPAEPDRQEEADEIFRAAEEAIANSEPEQAVSPKLGDTQMFTIGKKNTRWDDEPTSPRPKFNFDNLQFGNNYSDHE